MDKVKWLAHLAATLEDPGSDPHLEVHLLFFFPFAGHYK